MSILFVLVSLARGAEPTDAWTTREVPLHRWSDGAIVVRTLPEKARVEVLLVDGNQTRIRRAADFGWVPSDSLTKDAPPGAIDEAPDFGFGNNITIVPKPGGTPPKPPAN
jgi:hypothetical protein